MALSLKVVKDTILKQSPIDRSLLTDDDKVNLTSNEYDLHSWVDLEEDSHLRVAFAANSFNGRNTWYIYTGHAEVWNDGRMIRPLFPSVSTLLKNYKSCGTAGLHGLDKQLIAVMNEIISNALVDFSDLDVRPAGPQVWTYLQPPAKNALERAIRDRGVPLKLTSAYRTIAQQLVLFNHSKADRCGIKLAALPGKSHHQSGLAIDTPDWQAWKPVLEKHGWKWLGPSDPVHFDYVGGGTRNLRPTAIQAFQRLWNRNNISDQIADGGILGPQTLKRLNNSPIEGFGVSLGGFRGLRLSTPLMQGEDVRQVQQALINAGFDVGTKGADGQYGPATQTAVKRFQQARGLLVDGVVGAITLQELGLIKL